MSFDAYQSLGLKWTHYIPHNPTPKQLAFLLLPHREALYGGAAGGGKVVYDDAVVLTPFGFKLGKDLKLGDRVNNPDGSVSRIVLLHPRKKFKVWRVCFHDGSTTDVAEEHLWLAWRSGKRAKKAGSCRFGVDAAEVISTRELKSWVDTARNQEEKGVRPNWPCIPVAKPQVFNITRRKFSEINPYLLGVWLGDGHAGKSNSYYAGVTSDDLSMIEDCFSGLKYAVSTKTDTTACTYLLRGSSLIWFCSELKKLKLFGCHAWNKFIPEEFKLASIEKRLAVLQGLMDTDGYVDSRGQMYFTTTSQRLSLDVRFIVQSLGGTATETEKVGHYTSPEGDRIPCRTAYTLYIKLPSSITPFRLHRKTQRLRYDDHLYRRVVQVTPLEFCQKYGRCITVSHPNGLYLTNDFIVTHNSDCLLMAALQNVDCPGYAALIFRKTLTDLKQPGALIDRSFQWLDGTDAKWEASTHTWRFPTYDALGNPAEPAKLTFGYIGESQAKLRYLGIEVQFCAFDEVTQHQEDDYRYLFSRLRKCVCPIHKTKDGKPNYVDDCLLCQQQKSVPIVMRCATNPGGPGSAWITKRFSIGPSIDPKEQLRLKREGKEFVVKYVGKNPKRPFIPSFASDNPYLDQEGYAASLDELDPATRAMLRDGRWDVSPDSRFKRHWARYYSRRNEYFCLGMNGEGTLVHPSNLARIFVVVDPAASTKFGPGDTLTWKKDPSFTVIGVFGQTHDDHLLWLDMIRFRREIPEIIKTMKHVARVWRPECFYIEANGLGQGVYQGAVREGLTIQPLHTRVDKVVNASEAMIRMEAGRIWFPQHADWLETLENELFFWTGDPIRSDDIVDVLSNAAKQVAWNDPVVLQSDHSGQMLRVEDGLPEIVDWGVSENSSFW